MKTAKTRIIFAIVISLLLASVFVATAIAATAGSGYCVNDDGQETNIKWEMTADGVLSFAIDTTATGKVETTELFNKDPKTGDGGTYNKNLPTFAEAVKVVIGDGITAVAGFSYNRNLLQVELAPSVTVIKSSAFQSDSALQSVYVRGNEPVKGFFDLTNISAMYKWAFDGCKLMNKVQLSDKYNTDIPVECFKATTLKECEIPASVLSIGDKTFSRVKTIELITILGMETTIFGDTVFTDLASFPAIKAKAGSKAAEFATANGYTFIDLDTGVVTAGTKPTTGNHTSGEDTPKDPSASGFNHEGATLWGHSTRLYNGSNIVDTWWAYYDDTKTLEFVAADSGYKETGTLADVDDEYTDWSQYKDVIERVIIDDKIKKISGKAFQYYSALKEVRLGKSVNQIDTGAFYECSSLTSIWKNGEERVEGVANLSQILTLKDIIRGSSISDLVLPDSVSEITISIPTTLKNVYTNNITDALIKFAKDNLCNLYSISDPTVKYEYWVFVDPNLPACGERCVFSFDEATATLTVHGGGMIADIKNYYGGGSKLQPWIEIRDQVKHIIIEDSITGIGKYAFCELVNLETVRIPDVEEFEILSAAFEKCYNLKSVYRNGTEPIEGTLDLRNVPELNTYVFAYNYLIANVVISPDAKKVGATTFEENLTLNLANIYGVPGSFAETYAANNGLTFYDISSNTPSAITCTPPSQDSGDDTTDTTSAPDVDTNDPTVDTGTKTEDNVTDDTSLPDINYDDDTPSDIGNQSEDGNTGLLPVVIVIIAIVVVGVVAIIVLKRAKGAKRNNDKN